MRSAALEDSSQSISDASLSGCGPAKSLRHVAFFLDGTADEETKESERSHTSRVAVRRGMQAPKAADEHPAWSTRAAELDALRQRALQCGEDIARVASGLGYEVVAHTPTAFLKRNSVSIGMPAAAAKHDTQPKKVTAVDGALDLKTDSAVPLGPPCEAAPFLSSSMFLNEDASSGRTSRSSSPGIEEQVGLVPVLSPLLDACEAEPLFLPDLDALRSADVVLPRALSSVEGTTPYLPTEPSTQAPREGEWRWRDGGEGRGSPFGLVRDNSPAARLANTANHRPPSSTNSLAAQSTTSTTQSSPNATPSPRQSLTPRRAVLVRHQGSPGTLLGGNQSLPHRRVTRVNGTPSRGAGNANASGGVEHLSGSGLPALRTSQNTNRLLTPATEVLNTPAIRAADDDIWPRLFERPIQ